MQRDARISKCGSYRYLLNRRWEDGRIMTFVMLNPSTADAETDDATIRKCIGFAKKNGFGAVSVVNLYAFRATKPSDLKANGFPVGDDNDAYIQHAMLNTDRVVLAWGDNAREQVERVNQVLKIIKESGHRPYALKLTTKGVPSHPLMLPYSCELFDFYQALSIAA